MRYFLVLVGDLGGTMVIDRAAMVANETILAPDGVTYDVNQAIIGYDPWVATEGEVGEGAITGDPDGGVWLAVGNQLIAYAQLSSLLAGGAAAETRQMPTASLDAQVQGGGGGGGGTGSVGLSWTPFSASATVAAAPVVACKCNTAGSPPLTITLTLVGQEGEVCYVVNTGNGVVLLADSMGAAFGAETSYALPQRGQSVELSYTGGQWWIMATGT
jgi:hypothetical protein